MNKKILIVILMVGVAALGVGVYFAWEKYNNSGTIQPLVDQQPVNFAPFSTSASLAAKLKIITNEPIRAYLIVNATSTADIFYILNNGEIFSFSEGSQPKTVSQNEIKNILDINIASSGENLFIHSYSGEYILGILDAFSVKDKIWSLSIVDIFSADWSPSSNKLAFLKNNKGVSDLIIKDFSDAKQKETKIISLNLKDFNLEWVSENAILLESKAAEDIEGEIWKLDLKTKNLSKIISGKGLMASWSRFGDLGLKFSVKNNAYDVSLVGANGENKAALKFKTFPDKCVITSLSQIYCAIPKNQDAFLKLGLLDKYLKREVYFKDGIYQIDLEQNKFTPIYEGEELIIDAVDLKVEGNKLYFINRYDRKLYQLGL